MRIPEVWKRYLPFAAIILALGLFISVVPSTPGGNSHQSATEVDDLLSGGSASGESTGDDSGLADEASGPASQTDPQRGAQGPAGATDRTTDTGTNGGGPGQANEGPWKPTGSDCSRLEVISTPTCRPTPTFFGDNGGSTYKNVGEDHIRIVVYCPGRNEQVRAILEAAGFISYEDREDVLEAYERYFNRAFETYGREIQIRFQRGPGTTDPAEQAADARAIVEDLGATIVVSTAATPAFFDELARLQIPSVNEALPFSADFYQEKAPYVFGILPDLDLTLDHVSEYWCKRLDGEAAVHAGTPDLQVERELGVLYPADEGDALHEGGPKLQARIEGCGSSIEHMIAYPAGIGQAKQTATNAIVQMRDAGVNMITCLCDLVAILFFTSAATEQGYFPEWLQNGVFLSDSINAQRLYDQQQWRRAFGPSSLRHYTPLKEGPGFRAYRAGKPNGDFPKEAHSAGQHAVHYSLLMYALSGVEAAGPNLTPNSFARALFELPAMGGDGKTLRTSFGRQGPSPFTAYDDMMEIWWNADDNETPDGDRGWNWYVNGGARYSTGDWPGNKPNVFVNDGSPQPDRDPAW